MEFLFFIIESILFTICGRINIGYFKKLYKERQQ